MLQQKYLSYRTECQKLWTVEFADLPITLSQSCNNLITVLYIISICHAILDTESQAAKSDIVCAALNALRLAIRTCDQLIGAIMEMTPESTIEEILRLEAIAAYLAYPEADELLRSRLVDLRPNWTE